MPVRVIPVRVARVGAGLASESPPADSRLGSGWYDSDLAVHSSGTRPPAPPPPSRADTHRRGADGGRGVAGGARGAGAAWAGCRRRNGMDRLSRPPPLWWWQRAAAPPRWRPDAHAHAQAYIRTNAQTHTQTPLAAGREKADALPPPTPPAYNAARIQTGCRRAPRRRRSRLGPGRSAREGPRCPDPWRALAFGLGVNTCFLKFWLNFSCTFLRLEQDLDRRPEEQEDRVRKSKGRKLFRLVSQPCDLY